MSLKSILLALGIGVAGLTLSGCVSEGYYGSGNYDPYYVRGGYVGTGVVYDSGGYYRNYPRYYRSSRYYRDRDYYRYRDRDRPGRPPHSRPDRPVRHGRIVHRQPMMVEVVRIRAICRLLSRSSVVLITETKHPPKSGGCFA